MSNEQTQNESLCIDFTNDYDGLCMQRAIISGTVYIDQILNRKENFIRTINHQIKHISLKHPLNKLE